MSEAKCPIPSGLKLTALDPEFRENPSGPLAVLRSLEPVHKDRAFDRVVLTRAKDVASYIEQSNPRGGPAQVAPWLRFVGSVPSG